MPGTTGMDNERCRWELLHQAACAARVIQVYVGQDDVLNMVAWHAELGEGGQGAGHRGVDAGVDDGRTVGRLENVDGAQIGPHVAAVHRPDLWTHSDR